jgi:hypothetical protein
MRNEDALSGKGGKTREREIRGPFITGHPSRANQQRPHAPSLPYELNPFSRFFPVFSPFHPPPPHPKVGGSQ